MMGPQSARGYTIVETMIFLAVSALLFASVVGVMGERNRRTQFTQSVNNFNQKLLDLINDVNTGYYPTNSNFKCSVNVASGAPEFTNTSTEQGKNQDCVYVGRAFQFSPLESGKKEGSKVYVYTIVGTRYSNVTDKSQATSIEEAHPVALPVNYSLDTTTIEAQTEVKKVIYYPGNVESRVGGGFAVLNGFGQYANDAKLSMKSGNILTSVTSVPGTNVGQEQTVFLPKISDLTTDSVKNVTNGVLICMQEAGGANGRWASILIGGDAGANQSRVTIDEVPAECKT